MVALKKVKMDNEKEGFPITAIREIKILKNLKHPNIVQLKEIVTSKAHDHNKQKGSVYMVFEYAEHDLAGLMLSPKIEIKKEHVKHYLKQLLEGLHYLHTQKILHRDIKGANLLITKEGSLKIADFGLARSYNDPSVPLTKKVITLWYRPPEVLLESEKYGAPADIWSVGCIFAELLFKHTTNHYRNVWQDSHTVSGPHNETEQIQKIFDVFGTPSKEAWPSFERLPGMKNLKFKPKPCVFREHLKRSVQGELQEQEYKLLEGLLTLNPDMRMTAKQALNHDYFWTEPVPAPPRDLDPSRGSDAYHEWQVKKKRSAEKAQQQQQQQQQKQQQQGPPRPPHPNAVGARDHNAHPPHKIPRLGP